MAVTGCEGRSVCWVDVTDGEGELGLIERVSGSVQAEHEHEL